MIAEDSVRFAHFGPSQRILRGLATTCLRRAPPPAHVEATEKLYERHCLVIKIVSSFFCFSDKVFVSLGVDLQ